MSFLVLFGAILLAGTKLLDAWTTWKRIGSEGDEVNPLARGIMRTATDGSISRHERDGDESLVRGVHRLTTCGRRLSNVHRWEVAGGELRISHAGRELKYRHGTHETNARAVFKVWRSNGLIPSVSGLDGLIF